MITTGKFIPQFILTKLTPQSVISLGALALVLLDALAAVQTLFCTDTCKYNIECP